MHAESLEIFGALRDEDLRRKCTIAGRSTSCWAHSVYRHRHCTVSPSSRSATGRSRCLKWSRS
jgi:hypothetical protein